MSPASQSLDVSNIASRIYPTLTYLQGQLRALEAQTISRSGSAVPYYHNARHAGAQSRPWPHQYVHDLANNGRYSNEICSAPYRSGPGQVLEYVSLRSRCLMRR